MTNVPQNLMKDYCSAAIPAARSEATPAPVGTIAKSPTASKRITAQHDKTRRRK